MIWRRVEIEPQWVALALLVIAAALGRGKQFIFDFAPFLLLFFAYEVMRGFAAKTGFAPHDLAGLETSLFGARLPTAALQDALYVPSRVGVLDWAAVVFYFMHFVLPVGVGFYLWLRSRALYWRYVAALLLMSLLAFVTYLFFPSTPPWLQFPLDPGQAGYQALGPHIHKIADETLAKSGTGYYTSPAYSHLNPNRYAAFPSLHAAYPVLAAVYAWRQHRLLALALVAWSAAVWFSVVYLGEHYVVDALDGLIYVAVATVLVEMVARRGRAPATLPRPAL